MRDIKRLSEVARWGKLLTEEEIGSENEAKELWSFEKEMEEVVEDAEQEHYMTLNEDERQEQAMDEEAAAHVAWVRRNGRICGCLMCVSYDDDWYYDDD